MKEFFTRLVKEEEAELSMWITVILFLLITVAAYIIVWPKAKTMLVTATNNMDQNIGMIMDANAAGVAELNPTPGGTTTP